MTQFNSEGTNQRITDLFLRNQPQVGADVTTLSGRTQVDPATLTDALNIIFIGQSTNSNSVQGTMPTVLNPTKIFNCSIAHKGACFVAQQPLLTSDLTSSHHGMILADNLISAGLVNKVLLTSIICGGNYFSDWKPHGDVVGGVFAGVRTGELSYRIPLTGRCLYNQGLLGLKTVIDHQGGEWDSDPVATPTATSASAIRNIIFLFKEAQILKTGNVMFEHLNTRITNPSASRDLTRAAQTSVVDGVLVRAGADMDTLGAAFRYDGTHFNSAGAAAQANLKFPLYQNFILNG